MSIARCSSRARRASSCSSRTPAQQHGEFLAAPARDAVVGPRGGAQAAGDLDQHAIAGAVAERIVDLLEVVEVEQHETALVPGLERERDVLAQGEPVVRSRDDIGARLLLGLDAQLAQLGVRAAQLVDARLQAPLELAAVADVEHEAEADVAAVSAVVGHVAVEHPALDSVVADQAVGGLELRAVCERLGLAVGVCPVVGMDQGDPLGARGLPVDERAAREPLAVGAGADRLPVAVLVGLRARRHRRRPP